MTAAVTRMQEPSSGDLNRRVTFRLRVDLPTADMGLGPTYPLVIQRWAKIEPVGTAIYTGSAQTDSRITHRVTVRRLEGVTTSHEVVWGRTVYRVVRSAALNGGDDWTVFEVEELGEVSDG